MKASKVSHKTVLVRIKGDYVAIQDAGDVLVFDQLASQHERFTPETWRYWANICGPINMTLFIQKTADASLDTAPIR